MNSAVEPCLLVVDDDEEIRDLLARYLSEHGFRMVTAADGTAMRAVLSTQSIDLVILDLMLPGEDGLSLCRWLRSESATPIIMLTARIDQTERVVGLEVGADDYITKPFDPRELVARIRAVLRRSGAGQPASTEPEDSRLYGFRGWRLDSLGRNLFDPDGRPIELSAGEFDLLLTFVESPHRVLDRDTLLDRTRGRVFTPFDRSIDVQISRLRRKLERPSDSTPLIRTVRGAGYIFAARVERQ
jgi:two-component system OmpR family response regulator